MAIARLKPDAPVPVITTLPEQIEAPRHSTMTALVPDTKINSLLKYVEGYPWTVNYYGQILNSVNTLEQFDPGSPDLTQSYYKVSGLIIQVSSPLSMSYAQNTGITTVSGSGLMPFKVTPNVGDLFLAQIDTGEDAIFHVTSVIRKTHRKESLYEIEYSLHSYTNDQPEFLHTLERRLNETYYFNKDTNYFNRDVLLKPSVKEAIDRLAAFMIDSKLYYFKTFIQPRTGSLLLPGTDHPTYDPLLSNFISSTVEYSNIPYGGYFKPTFSSADLEQRSLLDCLVLRTLPHPHTTNYTYGFVPSTQLPVRARLGTLTHVGITDILYPVTPQRNHTVPLNLSTPNIWSNTPINEHNYYLLAEEVVKTTNNNELYTKPLLHPLFEDDYYLVTKHFYAYLNDNTQYDNISYLELLIARFLKAQAIAKEDLAVAVQSYRSWSTLHQFYLLPVLWLLVKAG